MTQVNIDLSDAPVLIPAQPPKEMISVSSERGKRRVRINSSSIGVIQECLRKAQYLLHEKWKPETEAPATVFGSAIHKALEVFYRGAFEDRILPDFGLMEMMSFGHRVPGEEGSLLLTATRAFLEKAEPLRPLPESDKRSLQNGVWILHNYFKTFLADPYVTIVDGFGPFVEREFTMRFFEDESLIVDVFGTIDFAFRHISDSHIIIGDHKTSSSFGFGGSSYFDRDKPNHQYTLYAMGARKVFGIQTNDFMVNVIEVKAKPKTSRGSVSSFPRQITTRTEEDFEEVKDVVMKCVRDYLGALDSGVWPLGPVGACTAYGSCSYRAVCSAPKAMRANILSAKFKQHGVNK